LAAKPTEVRGNSAASQMRSAIQRSSRGAKRKQPAFEAARLFNYRNSRTMLCLDKDQLLLQDFETLPISLVLTHSAANSPLTQEALTLVLVIYQITDVTIKSTGGP